MASFGELTIQPRDRGVITGASECGKSTLASVLIRNWQAEQCLPQRRGRHGRQDRQGRTMILDDKPRFRATTSLTGKSTKSRYKNFVKGDIIDGVVLDDMKNWDLVWDRDLNPMQTVIVQNEDLDEADIVNLCVQSAARYFKSQTPNRNSLLYVDEGLSFFGPNGNGRFGNAIQRCYRAGREKGLATLLAAQRPKQISMQCLTEANIGFVFRLNYVEDMKRLQEMGMPPMAPIMDDQIFYSIRKRKVVGPLRLKL